MPVEQYITPQLVCADVLDWARTYDGPPFHAMLCDPPYHLTDVARTFQGQGESIDARTGRVRSNERRYSKGFMGKDWDGGDIAYRPETWAALARHLLPGAFIMAFASSRGWHRLACAMEGAGLAIHPSIFNYRTGETLDIGMYGWSNGAGFPKATRIDTAVDAAAGVEREVVGRRVRLGDATDYGMTRGDGPWKERGGLNDIGMVTAPATPLAQAWAGHRYGLQALKPALEPIIVAQVPYAGRPVDSITATGAGALNIAGARIGTDSTERRGYAEMGYHGNNVSEDYDTGSVSGRWPANFALCHLPTCQPLGTRQVRDAGNFPAQQRTQSLLMRSRGKTLTPERTYAAPDGTEIVQAYACSAGCPVRALDSGTTSVAHNVLSGYNLSQEVRSCCVNASTAEVTLLLDRLMLREDLADSVAVPVDASRCASREDGSEPIALSESEMDDGIAAGESPVVGKSTNSLSIDGYGSKPMDQYPKGTKSIMPTMIDAITHCPTCNVCLSLHIEIITDDSEKTTVLSQTAPKLANVNDVPPTSHSARMLSVQRGPIRATVKIVNASPSVNGKPPIQTTTSSIYVDGENVGRHSRFFFTADWALDVAEQLAQADPVYYCPKASTSERHQGLDRRNDHPTVKPLTLLRWLATLLLPPAAYAPRRLLVPFCGTGSEMIGGILAGWETVVGIEQDQRSVDLASQRLAWWTGRKPETSVSPQDAQSTVPASTHAQLSLF